jgi:hypothetical protein
VLRDECINVGLAERGAAGILLFLKGKTFTGGLRRQNMAGGLKKGVELVVSGKGLGEGTDGESVVETGKDTLQGLQGLQGLQDSQKADLGAVDGLEDVAVPVWADVPGRKRVNSAFTRVPEPTFKAYYTDHANPAQNTKAFWKWRQKLTKQSTDVMMCYVYRGWPVLVQRGEDDDYIDKFGGDGLPVEDNTFNDTYGAGDYYVWVNEIFKDAEGKQKSRNLCKVHIKGSRDLKSRPPADRRISDPNQVEMTDPQNKSYIEFLQMRGVLPDMLTSQSREAAASAISAADSMGKTVDKMVDKVIKMAEGATSKNVDGDAAMRIVADAASQASKVQADAALKSNELLSGTFDKITEMLAQAKVPGGGLDLTAVMQLVQMLMERTGGTNPEVQALREQVEQMRQQQMQDLREEIRDMKAKAAGGGGGVGAVPGSPFTYFKDGIAAMKEMKDAVDGFSGGGGGLLGEAAEAAPVPGWLGIVDRLSGPITSLLNNGIQAYAAYQMRMAAAAGAPMPMPPGMPGNAPQPAPAPAPVTVIPMQPAHQVPQTAGALGPVAVPNPEVTMRELLPAIAVPLINYLEAPELNGEDFADWFIGGFGEKTFRGVVSQGQEAFMTAVAAYPQLQARLAAFPPERVMQFSQEFMTFDPDKAEDKEAELGPEGPAAS